MRTNFPTLRVVHGGRQGSLYQYTLHCTPVCERVPITRIIQLRELFQGELEPFWEFGLASSLRLRRPGRVREKRNGFRATEIITPHESSAISMSPLPSCASSP